MKIEYRSGDLFKTEIKYILHGTNSRGVMGSGVARIVRDRYPEAYERYTIWCSKGFRLGTSLLVECGDKTIINAVTQQNYGKVAEQTGPNPTRYVSYDAVADIFAQLEQLIPNTTIAMPLIGCSLGGGSWDVVSAIIEASCKTIKPIVYKQ